MRTIIKRRPPPLLTEWRTPRMLTDRAPGIDCDYSSLRRSPLVIEAVEDALLVEQGGICAYTGHRINVTHDDPAVRHRRDVDLHIEHLTPQDYCKEEYGNY